MIDIVIGDQPITLGEPKWDPVWSSRDIDICSVQQAVSEFGEDSTEALISYMAYQVGGYNNPIEFRYTGPKYIKPTCRECSALLMPRSMVDANAELDEWTCSKQCRTGFYTDWEPESYIKAFGEEDGLKWAECNCTAETMEKYKNSL